MLTVIASWPKSGNTWVRSILTCYIKNKCVPLDDMAATVPIDTSKGLWSEYVGMEIAENDSTIKSRVEFYRRLKEKIGSRNLYLKSHSANLTVGGSPMFDHASIDKIVHIVRNPFDVLPSFATHMNLSVEDAWDRMKNDKMGLGTTEKQNHELISSWELHTRSFLARNNEPEKYLFIRYEDLKGKPFSTVRKMIEFLGIGVDEERIVKSIYWSSFENRKKEEEDSGFKERPRDDTKFFRKGQIGSFKEDVPMELRLEMMARYKDFCGQLGYKLQ